MTPARLPHQIQTELQRIYEVVNPGNIGIIYWQQDVLNQITIASGPLAVTNEFQFHYWALIARQEFPDGSIIDFAFPTVVFNYKQEVSTSHIDFEMKEVVSVSEMLIPAHQIVVNKLLPVLQEYFKDRTVTFRSEPLNTMHRHPTGISSFSGTDLKKSHITETGIVFPLKTGNITTSFSSIIYNNPTKMVHTEYRLATGNVDLEEGITYQKGRCVTVVRQSNPKISEAERFLSVKSNSLPYIVNPTQLNISLDKCISNLHTLEYFVDTRFIKAENVRKKTYPIHEDSKYQFGKSKKKVPITENISVYSEELVNLLKNSVDLTIITPTELAKLHQPSLVKHLLELENYYYVIPFEDIENNEYDNTPKTELLEIITELQENIMTEIAEEYELIYQTPLEDIAKEKTISRKEMELDLASVGAPRAVLSEATDSTILRWWNEMFK